MDHICFRPKWEGGQYDGDENKRQKALQLAMELGADFIDIELKVSLPTFCILLFLWRKTFDEYLIYIYHSG